MKTHHIRLGTRGSALALAQANLVRSEILKRDPEISIEIKVIKTQGDKILTSSLSQIGGDGIFVKELEEALLKHDIDLAVHSLKDVPTTMRDDLCVAAVLKRDDWKDAFVSQKYKSLKELNEDRGFVVGTSSLRRALQIKHFYPNIIVKDIRGNVDTRIKKMAAQEFDGLVMSLAGLNRLGCLAHIKEELDFIPAPAQGAIGIQLRRDDRRMNSLVCDLNHDQTEKEVSIERLFLKKMGGGCRVPLGAKSIIQGQEFFLETFIASLDGEIFLKHNDKGFFKEKETVVLNIVQKIFNEGGKKILESLQ